MNAAEPPPGTGTEHRSHHNHKVIYGTCTERGGGIRFTNLVVTKRDGAIELNPHVLRQCMLILTEDAGQSLTLGEPVGTTVAAVIPAPAR